MSAGNVVDASVVVAALVDSGTAGQWSEGVIAEGFSVAPQLVIVEALNILRRLELAKQLSEIEAAAAQQHLHELEVELMPIRPFEERIWQLRKNLSCYDAWYVAIAETMELPLATLDQRLARASGPLCAFRQPI